MHTNGSVPIRRHPTRRNPNPNPNFGESGFGESGFGESGRHRMCYLGEIFSQKLASL